MVGSRIVPGIRVLSRDGDEIGTVEIVRNDHFTVVDPRSNARGQVQFDRVQSVDEQIHLNCKATEIPMAGAGMEPSKGKRWLAPVLLVAVIVLIWWGWHRVVGMLAKAMVGAH